MGRNFFWLYLRSNSKKWWWTAGKKADLKGDLVSGLKMQLLVDKQKLYTKEQRAKSKKTHYIEYTVYWLGKGDLGVWMKILKAISEEHNCSKAHIVCVCLYFSSDFEEKGSVYIWRYSIAGWGEWFSCSGIFVLTGREGSGLFSAQKGAVME